MTDTAMEKKAVESSAIVVAGLTAEQVGLIKRTICAGYSDDEMMLFLFQAQRKGLDPLSREIYSFKDKKDRIQIITGIDGFRSRADSTGKYMPGREPTFEAKGELLISATAYIQRWDELTDAWVEVAATAWLVEQKRGTDVWAKMPRVMLAKCAEAFAFRRAFPSELGGLYTSDEMDGAELPPPPLRTETPPITVDAEVVEPSQPDPKRIVWEVAKEVGLKGDDVVAVVGDLGLSTDGSKWTVRNVEAICDALRARAKAATFEQPPEEPPPAEEPHHEHEPDAPYLHARRLARDLGASLDQWEAALRASVGGHTPEGDWTQDTVDEVIVSLEHIMGV